MEAVLVESMSGTFGMDNTGKPASGSQYPILPRPMSPTTPSKRPYPHDNGVADINTHSHDRQEATSSPVRPASPSLSDTSSVLSSAASIPQPAGLDGTVGATSAQPPVKRRRLTPAEKIIKEQEKAEQQRIKEKKRAERREQHRAKEEEVEERRRERELRKQEKDMEKQRKDEDKAKKERAQPRMTAFFAKPKSATTLTPVKNTSAIQTPVERDASPAPSHTPTKTSSLSDYNRIFLPFEAPSNSVVAPVNRFTWDAEATGNAGRNADLWFSKAGNRPRTSLCESLDLSPLDSMPRAKTLPPTAKVVAQAAGSTSSPVDLTCTDARAALRALPVKYIFFHQDVRPPYIGTMSKGESSSEKLRVARNPFRKSKPEIDYDYDSEAEWEEPEEGEDLDSEADDEAESQGDAEDIDEFLDDEGQDDAQKQKRKFLSSDMQPVSTGLCWENRAGKLFQDANALACDPREFRMESLMPHDFPLDPFATHYWVESTPAATSVHSTAKMPTKVIGARPPLQARPNIAMNSRASATAGCSTITSNDSKAVKILTGPELDVFKELVNGSDLTKTGILAVLKKRLPKVPNTMLNNTLSSIAARVGVKEVDKRWRLLL